MTQKWTEVMIVDRILTGGVPGCLDVRPIANYIYMFYLFLVRICSSVE